MLVGIGVFGLFTASVASFFVESDARKSSDTNLADEVRELRAQIADLHRELVTAQDQADG